MSPRKKPAPKPARSTIPGLRRRGNRAYWSRELPAGVGGDRLSRALDAEWETDVATTRAAALNTLYDRGDWTVLRRWAEGAIHVSRIVTSVRDGDWQGLRTLDRSGVRLGTALAAHLERMDSTQQPATARNHRTVANLLLETLGADYDMARLTTAEAEAILHAPRNGKPWLAGTQQTVRVTAGAIWRGVIEAQAELAEMSGLLPALTRNPWRKATTRGHRKVRPPVLDEAQMRALLTHPTVAGTPTGTMLAIGLLAGLRQAEILYLRVGVDVLMDERVLRVQSRKGARPHAWRPKSRRSERDVPMTDALHATITEHIRRGYAGRRYLLTTPQTGDVPVSPHTSARWTEAAFRALRLPYGRHTPDGMTIHHLRHSYATLLLSRGIGIATVAEMMGDRQETVLATYSHALRDDRRAALQVLGGVL